MATIHIVFDFHGQMYDWHFDAPKGYFILNALEDSSEHTVLSVTVEEPATD